MIEYVAEYTEGQKPSIKKVFTATSEETFSAEIVLGLEEEIRNISTELIYNHLRNLIRYIKNSCEYISITEKDDDNIEAWPIKGWEKIENAKNEALDWWEIAYFRDEEEEPSDA